MTSCMARKARMARHVSFGLVLATLAVGAVDASTASAASMVGDVARTSTSSRTTDVDAVPAFRSPSAHIDQPSTVRPAQAPPSWHFSGVFPEPISCHVAGLATGLPYFCGFYFFFWGLNVLF